MKKLLLLLSILGFTVSFSQNNYLDFDGVNDNVDIPNSGNAVVSATAITLSCKVFPKSTTMGFPNFNGFAGYRKDENNQIKFEDYLHIYNDSLEDRNKIHKMFNKELKDMCDYKGYKFVDIWDDITTNDVINSEFKLDKVDHHLKESEELFNILYKKILKLYE